MSGMTPECAYIGGHALGFDPECHWCVTENARLARRELCDPNRYPTPSEWAAFVRLYLT